jgi:formate hydrogenlyase subunit 6/NADH:ubiquinone oxidoreductase subunit I
MQNVLPLVSKKPLTLSFMGPVYIRIATSPGLRAVHLLAPVLCIGCKLADQLSNLTQTGSIYDLPETR